jgi:hypothetical protein
MELGLVIVLALVVFAAVVMGAYFLYQYEYPKATFVGAFARTPAMQHCLAYPGLARRGPYFNRCAWV